MQAKRMSSLHRVATGIPPKLPVISEVNCCPTCLEAKIRHRNRSTDDSRHATQCYQGLSVDFGFVVQKSDDSRRYNYSKGLQDKTSQRACHRSPMWHAPWCAPTFKGVTGQLVNQVLNHLSTSWPRQVRPPQSRRRTRTLQGNPSFAQHCRIQC